MNLELFVADDFRLLADGKMLAVGLYADRVIILQAPQEAMAQMPDTPLGTRLSLLTCFGGLDEGERRFLILMKSPEMAEPRALGEEVQRPVQAGRSANLIINLDPFLVRAAGRFEILCVIDGDTTLTAGFEVRLQA